MFTCLLEDEEQPSWACLFIFFQASTIILGVRLKEAEDHCTIDFTEIQNLHNST